MASLADRRRKRRKAARRMQLYHLVQALNQYTFALTEYETLVQKAMAEFGRAIDELREAIYGPLWAA